METSQANSTKKHLEIDKLEPNVINFDDLFDAVGVDDEYHGYDDPNTPLVSSADDSD